MAVSPPPYDNLWKYFRDVTLAFLIIVGGFVVAGAIVLALFEDYSRLAYPIALCIGLIPFWWFTRYCHIHNSDFYDYLALMTFFLLAMAIWEFVLAERIWDMQVPVVVAASGGLFYIWRRIRHSLTTEMDDESVTQ